MERVLVLGCPGSGKSTFSRTIRDITGLSLFHLDMIWHKPDRTNISKEEFQREVVDLSAKEQWILDGNYIRSLDTRLQRSDTVFLFDYSIDICVERARARIGKKREDMPWIETEFDAEFEEWIKNFPQNQLPYIYQALEKYNQSNTIEIFKSPQDTAQYLKNFAGG